MARYYSADPIKEWVTAAMSTARARALRYGLAFSITAADLQAEVATHCPALGIPLDYSRGRMVIQDDSPTVDRIIPPLGYVPGNIAIISNKANLAKSRCSPEELFSVGRWHGKQLALKETQDGSRD